MRPLRCLLILLIVLLPAGPFATTFPVTKTEDTDDGVCDPDCSLREAIEAANTNLGADDVPIPAGFYLLTLGQLTVSDEVSIAGAGQTTTIIDGNATGRVFNISYAVAEISGVAIQNGHNGNFGGGIFTHGGTLTLTNSTVSGNIAQRGGGIFNYGYLTLTDSTVSGNESFGIVQGGGGGILNYYGGTVTLINSTVSGNSARDGGGIHNSGAYLAYDAGTVTLINSTVSGNTASGGHLGGYGFGTGGGIYNAGELSLTNSTVSGNESFGGGGGIFIDLSMSQYGVTITNSTVSDNYTNSYFSSGLGRGGGGILVFGRSDLSPVTLTLVNSTVSGNYAYYPAGGIRNSGGTIILSNSTVSGNRRGISNSYGSYGGTVTATNTIVADNSAYARANCDSPINSLGYNLTDDTSCGFSATGDLVVADVGLGPLQDNGGPTETHDLLPGSPAIDAGSVNCPPPDTDQRGVARPQGATCDIGAVEFVPEPHQAATMVAGAALLALLYRRRTRGLEGTVCSGQF